MKKKTPQKQPRFKEKEPMQTKELFLFEPKTLTLIIVTSILTLLVAFLGEQGVRLFTSVISAVPEHAPFDGTTSPIKQVPNWVKLTEQERKAAYSGIPQEKFIPIPSYNPARLAIPTQSLRWNDENDDAIRNEKITFSTPYLGSYRLDGLENTGSHPAIDIKVPEGTPIYAMANGAVIKAENGNGGFGNHIVLQHTNFPSLDDSQQKVTIHSAYAHLSSLVVKANDVVTKGQLIGYSGMSGTATTPHLHFQIDTSEVSWHPYWPFNTSDMRAAGLSFFEAINAGLKKDNAILYTINPLKYVQKYAGDQTLVASAISAIPLAPALPAVPADDGYSKLSFVIQTVSSGPFREGEDIGLVIQVFDAAGNLLSNPNFSDLVQISLLNGLGALSGTSLNAQDLKTGIASSLKITGPKVGTEKIIVRFRDREFSSAELTIQPRTPVPQGFFVFPRKASVTSGESTELVVRAVDLQGNKLDEFVLDETPSLEVPSGTLSTAQLALSSFSQGEAVVTFTAQNTGEVTVKLHYHGQEFQSPIVTVAAPPQPVEPPVAPVFVTEDTGTTTPSVTPEIITPEVTTPEILVGTTTPPVSEPVAPVLSTPPMLPETPAVIGTSTPAQTPGPFIDISADSPYADSLTYLKKEGLVTGYGDGTFQPDRSVSRAEAVTLILRAIDHKTREQIQKIFPDVSLESWYAKFVFTAFELGFVKGYPDGSFRPDAQVTLAEFFSMLFIAARTDIDPQTTDSLPEGVIASEWYAPYLQEAIRQDILVVENNRVDPAKPLTRGDVAKILYRMRLAEMKE